jgi:predicted DNA-binding WGR domain protein
MLPPLYKNSNRGTEEWTVRIENKLNQSDIIVSWGIIGGKFQEKVTTITDGKNIGKSNETTFEEQALSEAQSKWNKQLDKGYSKEKGAPKMIRPMLAHKYQDHSSKLKFPCYIQPKLDGCLSGDSLLMTKKHGLKTIKEIVENKLDCLVKSFNIRKNRTEYKKVISWYKNRKLDNKVQWFEIELTDGRKLNLTGNHKVYLPDLNCWRRVDELDGSENLMVH